MHHYFLIIRQLKMWFWMIDKLLVCVFQPFNNVTQLQMKWIQTHNKKNNIEEANFFSHKEAAWINWEY